MTRGPSGPGDNSGKRFEEIIDRLYWRDEEESDEEPDAEEDEEQ